MRLKWPPFCNFRGALFQERGKGSFAAILEHSGELKKSGLELLLNPGCLPGEIMSQTKKRKAIETVRGYRRSKKVYRVALKSVFLSPTFSNTLF